jgi:signal transduction histidine kinase
MTTPSAPAPPKLYRASERRLLGGVARGLAVHLGVDTTVLRIIFVLLVFADGVGVVVYALFWIVVPLAVGPQQAAPPARPARAFDFRQFLTIVAIGLGAFVILLFSGIGVNDVVIWPVLVVGTGVVILWRQADDAQHARWARLGTGRWGGVLRGALGAAAVLLGLSFLVGRGSVSVASQFLLAVLPLSFGIGLIAGPYLVRMTRELSAERRERIRAQERAEVAAHIHDSVLHTLTLIQRNVESPREVARLARAQERDLRTWLYRPADAEDVTLAAAVRRTVAEVEDAHGVAIEVVCVGDCPLDEHLTAQLSAAREAMVNAAKYAGQAGPISVYAEVESHQVTVFVRDRGPGFDLSTVPDDRLGVRESIVGRMKRNGGVATVRASAETGTEVQLEMARSSHD